MVLTTRPLRGPLEAIAGEELSSHQASSYAHWALPPGPLPQLLAPAFGFQPGVVLTLPHGS